MVKNPPTNADDERDTGLIPKLGRSPGGGNINPLQYSWVSLRGDFQALLLVDSNLIFFS